MVSRAIYNWCLKPRLPVNSSDGILYLPEIKHWGGFWEIWKSSSQFAPYPLFSTHCSQYSPCNLIKAFKAVLSKRGVYRYQTEKGHSMFRNKRYIFWYSVNVRDARTSISILPSFEFQILWTQFTMEPCILQLLHSVQYSSKSAFIQKYLHFPKPASSPVTLLQQ